jgi:hypothetical protein
MLAAPHDRRLLASVLPPALAHFARGFKKLLSIGCEVNTEKANNMGTFGQFSAHRRNA